MPRVLVAAAVLALLILVPSRTARLEPGAAEGAAEASAATRLVVTLRAPLNGKAVATGSALDIANKRLGAQMEPIFWPPPTEPAALARFVALGMDRMMLVRASADQAVALAVYQASPDVESAAPDGVGIGGGELAAAPDDPGWSQQWHMARVNALGAWDIATGNPELVIAVIDSGIWHTHPDLSDRLWRNSREIPANGLDDDGNGFIDDDWGWDFVGGDNDPNGDHWHGTHVAGIIGATANNGIGVAGLDRGARLMAVKVLDNKNQGYYSDWSRGIYYAAQNGARILNLSLGGTDSTDTDLRAAVSYAHGQGALLAVAMMNSNDATRWVPAAYTNVIAVGATDSSDRRASPFDWGGGSCYGNGIDVVAPGNVIYSAVLNNGYATASGTSMATPLVAGLAGLIWSVAPGLSNEQIRQALHQTAIDGVGRAEEDTPGWDRYMGYGRIDAARAVARARDLAAQATTTPTATLLPSPSPTATRTATATLPPPTATRTATATLPPPTATRTATATLPPPTATPLPASCVDSLTNGSFANADGWTLAGRRALISGYGGRNGTALFLGLQSGDTVQGAGGDTATGRQSVTLPADATQAKVVFWAFTGHTGGPDVADRFTARLLAPDGASLVDASLVVDSNAYREVRLPVTSGLDALRGQSVTLHFQVDNIAGPGGNAYMRIDDASLVVCRGGAHLPTPSATPGPTATPTHTATPRPTSTPYPDGPYHVHLPLAGLTP